MSLKPIASLSTVLARGAAAARTAGAAKDGGMAVELAFVLPLLMLLLGGVIDFGRVMYQGMELQNAARAGAQQALKDPSDSERIKATIKKATGANYSTMTITVSQFCECADGSALTCGATCQDKSTTLKFSSVVLTQPFTSLFPDFGISPTVTGSAIVRTQ